MPAAAAGYADLLAWASAAAGGSRVAWAVEGTRHYGLGLARYLAAEGQEVTEIDSTRHVGKRRPGKSDPIDAVRAAVSCSPVRRLASCAVTGTGRRCDC